MPATSRCGRAAGRRGSRHRTRTPGPGPRRRAAASGARASTAASGSTRNTPVADVRVHAPHVRPLVVQVVVGVLPLRGGHTLSHSQAVEWMSGSCIQSHWPCITLWPISMFSRILDRLEHARPRPARPGGTCRPPGRRDRSARGDAAAGSSAGCRPRPRHRATAATSARRPSSSAAKTSASKPSRRPAAPAPSARSARGSAGVSAVVGAVRARAAAGIGAGVDGWGITAVIGAPGLGCRSGVSVGGRVGWGRSGLRRRPGRGPRRG